MKKLIAFLILFVTGASMAQEIERLPVQPWKDILEMNSHEHTPMPKWTTDVNIGLEGRYTQADSLAIVKAVKKLDSLTEAISVTFANNKEVNLKVMFLDTLVKNKFNYIINSHSYFNDGLRTEYSSAIIYIYRVDKTDEAVRKTLESRLAKTLVNGNFLLPFRQERRHSIFNPMADQNNSSVPLSSEDVAIVKEVYSKDYETKLKLAEMQLELTVKNINDYKISQRQRTIWWVKNPISVLILPTILLVLAFAFLVKKINQSFSGKIKKDWLRFGVMVLITLFFADIIIVFCVSAYDFLTIPDVDGNNSFIRRDTVITTSVLLYVLVFPFLFLLRFIELKISKSSQQVFIKTILIFISTGLLPFAILFSLVYFTTSHFGRDNQYFLANTFLILTAVASARALISYFIFKERHLIIENETKLSKLRELKTQAELKSLHSQINPHFLYNSLNSIASLAPINATKTQSMACALSDLFKYSINRKGKKMSAIKDEVEMVTTYLDIEKIRFGERLLFNVSVDKSIENHQIPLFLIQPLVENAVKHGISKQADGGVIDLKIKSKQDRIHISVADSGPNFPEGVVSGHGLQTVYDLLRLSYNDKASLNWSNHPKKEITITIPKNA